MPNPHCDVEDLGFWTPDPRADSGLRRIRLARESIHIERKVAGIGMYIDVPLAMYRGVTLRCERKLHRNFYRITLTHRDPDLSVILHRAMPTPALVDIWQSWARFLSKPVLFEEGEGIEIRTSRNVRRRRSPSLVERRPAIYSRRPAGWRASRIFRPTRELFSRE